MLRVNGGPAHSGTVIKRERGDEWKHTSTGFRAGTCVDKTLPGYWVKCPDCGQRRPL